MTPLHTIQGGDLFCQWTGAKLYQQKTWLLGPGFNVAGLVIVRGLQINLEISRYNYMHLPLLFHLLSASFIPEACKHRVNKRVHEFSVVVCADACPISFLEDFPCLRRCST